MTNQNWEKEIRKVIEKCFTPNAIYAEPISRFIRKEKEKSYKDGVKETRENMKQEILRKLPKEESDGYQCSGDEQHLPACGGCIKVITIKQRAFNQALKEIKDIINE